MTALPAGPGPRPSSPPGRSPPTRWPRRSRQLVGPRLAFYDAIAPVVTDESVDRTIAFAASRWGKGEGDDYLNLPLDAGRSTTPSSAALLAAEKVAPHGFEEPRYFEGCLPIEVMAERGPRRARATGR